MGSCINRHTLFIENETFGLINERYCKLPTVLLDNVTFLKGGESKFRRLVEVDMSEEMELAPLILVFLTNSRYIFASL